MTTLNTLGDILTIHHRKQLVYTHMINEAYHEDKQRFTTHAIQAKDLVPHYLRWTVFYGMNDIIMNGKQVER